LLVRTFSPQLHTRPLRLGDLDREKGDVAAATFAYQRVLGAAQGASTRGPTAGAGKPHAVSLGTVRAALSRAATD